MNIKKGQMIIEAMIAFSVSMVALVALLQLSNRSAANSGLANRSAIATAYADEGINWVKQQRKNMTWDAFLAAAQGGGHSYCLMSPPFSFTLGGCNPTGNEITGTIYTRNLTMTTGIRNSKVFIGANVTITWPEGNRTKTVQRRSEFFNNN
jgi:hypothetical protein